MMLNKNPSLFNIETSLSDDIKNIYFQYIEKKGIPLSCMVNEILEEITSSNSVINKDALSAFSVNSTRNRNRTKLRWVKTYISKIATQLNDSSDLIQQSKYFSEEFDSLNEWANNSNAPLYSFKYFNQKNASQRYKAFILDLSKEIVNIIHQDLANSNKGDIMELPIQITDQPIFSIKKSKLDLYSGTDEYQVNGNYFLRTSLIENDTIQSKISVKNCYTLDEKDAQIISHIFSCIQPSFHDTKGVTVDLRKMAKKLYKYVNSYAYKDIEDRLFKMTNLRTEGIIKEGNEVQTKFKIVFFPAIYIDKDAYKITATVTFSEPFYDAFIKKKTIKVASEQYYILENTLSRILFFALQKKRLNLWGKGLIEDTISLPYDFFKYWVRFKSSNKNRNITLIKEALQCFIDHKILIKSYSYDKYEFNVVFMPLSPQEVEVLGLNHNSNALNHLEDIPLFC